MRFRYWMSAAVLVSALLLTFSLRATCDDLLCELLVLDRLSPPRRVEQDRDAFSSGAPHGIALVDSGLEGQPAEDAVDVLGDVPRHPPGLLYGLRSHHVRPRVDGESARCRDTQRFRRACPAAPGTG